MPGQIFSNVSPLPAYNINFSTTNLQNNSGVLNTIQDINTTADPQFDSLLLQGAGASPMLAMYDTATVTNNSQIDLIRFEGINSLSAPVTYAQITPSIIDRNSASSCGQLNFDVLSNTVLTNYISVNGKTDQILFNQADCIFDTSYAQFWTYGSGLKFYTDDGVTLQGQVGLFGNHNDFTIASLTSNWIRIGANGNRIAFWTDGNIGVNDLPQAWLDTGAIFHTSGLSLVSTANSLLLNVLTNAQFDAQPPSQGSIAYSTDEQTIIMRDGMTDQYLATQAYVNGILNNPSIAAYYQTSSNVITFSTTSYVPVSVAVSADNPNLSNTGFTLNTSAGVLTYTGPGAFFRATWTASIASSSGLPALYYVTIGRNGTAVTSCQQYITYSASDASRNVSVTFGVYLNTGDTLQPYVRPNANPTTWPMLINTGYFLVTEV